ncbi:hypothetical protein [Deinococcus sp. NW-56]|uniref:hypothetical protein n=1 Tax=Deinococcus sp. NW-56 TaxID=2080419 RepID=UPI000CF5161D|nr:hypothetical protein [Deinococcus sp. NW-56]
MTGRAAEPNRVKQERYARAHERLTLALEHGFYIEAAMICESILTDRLHSHLHWRVEGTGLCTLEEVVERLAQKSVFRKSPPQISLTKPSSMFVLIMAMGLDFDDLGLDRHRDLPQRLNRWREDRNKITHNITYTRPDLKSYDEAFAEFMATAEGCAKDGKLLVGCLTDWDRAVRRRHARASHGV